MLVHDSAVVPVTYAVSVYIVFGCGLFLVPGNILFLNTTYSKTTVMEQLQMKPGYVAKYIFVGHAPT